LLKIKNLKLVATKVLLRNFFLLNLVLRNKDIYKNMRKYFITFALPLLFALQAMACGEKTSATMQNINEPGPERKVCPATQKICPPQCPGKGDAAATQAVLASNTESVEAPCNTTRVALSMAMGLGLILGLSLITSKAKI
jgi:hypothetical protein